jgi:hypothetical protein
MYNTIGSQQTGSNLPSRCNLRGRLKGQNDRIENSSTDTKNGNINGTIREN